MTNARTAKLLGDPAFRDEPLTDARRQIKDAEREIARIAREQRNLSRHERILLGIKERENKYGAVKTTIDGYRFDSKAEAAHYADLKLRQLAGEISDLTIHPRYPLYVNGVNIGTYTADFRFVEDGATKVEDVKCKPTMTPAYRIKKRLVKALYAFDIIEVEV